MIRRTNMNTVWDFFFLRDIVGCFMECQVFSRRLNQNRLTAIPFSITVKQVYASAINYGERVGIL